MSEPKWLREDVVIAVQQGLIALFGGIEGVRDAGLLASALDRPRNLLHYDQADIFRLAAGYGYGLTANHCFMDGNKRIAATATIMFMELNGYNFNAPEAEVVVVFRALASGDFSENELVAWIRDYSAPSIR